MRCLATFCALVAATVPTWASAETLFSTSYEPPTYSVGPLDGQGGWDAQFFDVAEVTSDFWLSGSQSVEFDGINEFAQQIGPFPTPKPVVVVQQAVYIDGPDENELLEEGFFVTPHAIGGDDPDNDDDDFIGQISVVNGDGPLGLGASLGLSDASVGFVPVEVGQWFVLEHVLNFASQTQAAYVDGQFIASAPFATQNTEIDRVEMVVLNIPIHHVYFDDLSITAIPEPSTVLMGALAVAGMLLTRRRG